MFRSLLITALGIVLSAGAANKLRDPVLVELFTSEGCSSCPPADQLLKQLDAQVIVLSEHVDYWDHQGWKDRFSSPEFTARQEKYARQFGIDGPYTPQMVVDGVAQFVGGDPARAASEIFKAGRHPKATLQLSREGTTLTVKADQSPGTADVMLAVVAENAITQVTGGENKGRELRHAGVVMSVKRIGSIRRGGSFSTQMVLPRATVSQRLVVFLQDPDQMKVYGAGLLVAGGS